MPACEAGAALGRRPARRGGLCGCAMRRRMTRDERAMTLARSGARPLMHVSGFEPWRVGGSRDGAPFGKAWA